MKFFEVEGIFKILLKQNTNGFDPKPMIMIFFLIFKDIIETFENLEIFFRHSTNLIYRRKSRSRKYLSY